MTDLDLYTRLFLTFLACFALFIYVFDAIQRRK